MKWEYLENDKNYHYLKVEADWSELAVDYNDLVREYMKLPVSGFRKGKVPRKVIEKQFHDNIIEDLSKRVTQRFGLETIQLSSIKVLGAVGADEVECEKEKAFSARLIFQPMPEFEVPNLKNLLNDSDSNPLDQISFKLLDLVQFEIHDNLIVDELARIGIDSCQPNGDEWNAASDRIRLTLILKQIAQQEGITVDDIDVDKKITEKAAEFSVTENALKTEMVQDGSINILKDMLLAESTLDYLVELNSNDI
jgi:FKBP-type peptidyl-prolyl cis-trans isomerase (trigger factor)